MYINIKSEIAAISHGNVIADLSEYTVVQISGPDSQKFLQSQLTCNLQEITSTQSRIAAHCNLQGRVVSLGRLLKIQDDYIFLLPKNIAELAISFLKKYAIFSKVQFNILQDWSCIGLSGNNITPIIDNNMKLPSSPNTVTENHGTTYLREYGEMDRYIAIGPKNNIQKLWQNLSKQLTPVHMNAWLLGDIEAGLVYLSPETSGLFLPQELNLVDFQAVSFTKGCYLGQEIIARLHYLGKLKKHLGKIHFNLEKIPTPGMNIDNAQLIYSVAISANQYTGLAIMNAHQNL